MPDMADDAPDTERRVGPADNLRHFHGHVIAFIDALDHALPAGRGYVAPCPVHYTAHPTLSIQPYDQDEDGAAVIRCHKGCELAAILAAVGIAPSPYLIAAKPDPSDASAVKYLDLETIRRNGVQPPPWIIDGWLAEQDIALLAGGGGIGKSTTAAALAVSLSQGRSWCGIEPKRAYRTIYFDEEQDENTTGMLFVRLGGTNGALRVASGQRISLYGPEALERLEREIGTHDPEIIVLDSVQQTFGPIEENSASAVGAVYAQMFRLRDQYRLTFVLVHHKKKSGQHPIEALEMVRGSTAHGTQCSTVWYATPGDTANTMRLVQAKRRRAMKTSISIRYEEDSPVGNIRLVGEGPLPDPTTELEKCSDWLILWLAEHGEARRAEIVIVGERNGYRAKTIDRTLQHLVSMDVIMKPKRGRYAAQIVGD